MLVFFAGLCNVRHQQNAAASFNLFMEHQMYVLPVHLQIKAPFCAQTGSLCKSILSPF